MSVAENGARSALSTLQPPHCTRPGTQTMLSKHVPKEGATTPTTREPSNPPSHSTRPPPAPLTHPVCITPSAGSQTGLPRANSPLACPIRPWGLKSSEPFGEAKEAAGDESKGAPLAGGGGPLLVLLLSTWQSHLEPAQPPPRFVNQTMGMRAPKKSEMLQKCKTACYHVQNHEECSRSPSQHCPPGLKDISNLSWTPSQPPAFLPPPPRTQVAMTLDSSPTLRPLPATREPGGQQRQSLRLVGEDGEGQAARQGQPPCPLSPTTVPPLPPPRAMLICHHPVPGAWDMPCLTTPTITMPRISPGAGSTQSTVLTQSSAMWMLTAPHLTDGETKAGCLLWA